jgi:hypothetical protein
MCSICAGVANCSFTAQVKSDADDLTAAQRKVLRLLLANEWSQRQVAGT